MLDRMFLEQASGIGAPYWVGQFGTSANEFDSVALDSSANVNCFGYQAETQGGANYDFEIAKFTNAGAEIFQRKLGSGLTEGFQDYRPRLSAVDNSGNVIIGGNSGSIGFLAKYNASGVLQWQKNIKNESTQKFVQGIRTDSSGNIYVLYQASDGSYFRPYIFKLDASGNQLWAYSITYGQPVQARSIAVGPSGDVLFVGVMTNVQATVLVRFSAAGANTWSYAFGGSGGTFYGTDCAFDSTGNFYISGGFGSNGSAVIKFYSFNAFQWGSYVPLTSQFPLARTVAVDGSGNVYAAGEGDGNYAPIVKFSTSGSLLWQRSISVISTGSQTRIRSCAVDVSGNFYFCGNTSGQAIVGKLPADGTLTGTYAGPPAVTYRSTSGTEQSLSITENTSYPPTITSATLSSSTSSLTDTATTLAFAKVTL